VASPTYDMYDHAALAQGSAFINVINTHPLLVNSIAAEASSDKMTQTETQNHMSRRNQLQGLRLTSASCYNTFRMKLEHIGRKSYMNGVVRCGKWSI